LVVVIAYLHNLTGIQRGCQTLIIQADQALRDLLQHFQFVRINIGSLVLSEPEEEEPPPGHCRRHQRSRAAALAGTGERDPLLHHVTAEVRVDEPLRYLSDGAAQRVIREPDLAHPATERAGSERPFHE
jgi:hypothetical protein